MKRHEFAILILATLFAPLSLSAQGLDYNILCTLQQNRTETMDHVMTGLSNTLALTPVAPAAMLGTGWMTDNKELLVSGASCGLSLLLTFGVTEGLKFSVRRPRPYLGHPDDLVPLKTVRGFSFPSGHTSLSFATATSLCLNYPRWYVVLPAALWASGVGFSRLYLGVHYPSDVLVGALVGIGSALAAHWIVDKIQEESPVPATKAFLLPITLRF